MSPIRSQAMNVVPSIAAVPSSSPLHQRTPIRRQAGNRFRLPYRNSMSCAAELSPVSMPRHAARSARSANQRKQNRLDGAAAASSKGTAAPALGRIRQPPQAACPFGRRGQASGKQDFPAVDSRIRIGVGIPATAFRESSPSPNAASFETPQPDSCRPNPVSRSAELAAAGSLCGRIMMQGRPALVFSRRKSGDARLDGFFSGQRAKKALTARFSFL